MGTVHIMLMENALRLKDKDNLKYIFDLKGSTGDRLVKGMTGTSTTLKDVNFMIALEASPRFIDLEEWDRKRLLGIVKKDVDFLSSLGFMDYSLLIGIEKLKKEDVIESMFEPEFLNFARSHSQRKKKSFHQLAARPISVRRPVSGLVEEVTNVGERMSRQHCFLSGNRAYHITLIDFL